MLLTVVCPGVACCVDMWCRKFLGCCDYCLLSVIRVVGSVALWVVCVDPVTILSAVFYVIYSLSSAI